MRAPRYNTVALFIVLVFSYSSVATADTAAEETQAYRASQAAAGVDGDGNPADSDGTAKVAVVGFKASGMDEATVQNLSELFTTEIGGVPGYKVIGQSEVRDLLGYQAAQAALGCDNEANPKCLASLQSVLGVDLIITGTVGTVGDTFVVSVQLIDIVKVETVGRFSGTVAGSVEVLLPFIRVAAWKVLGVEPPQSVLSHFRRVSNKDDGAAVTHTAAGGAAKTQPAPHAAVTPQRNGKPPWQRRARSASTLVGLVGVFVGLGTYGWAEVQTFDKNADAITAEEQDTADTFKGYAKTSGIVAGVGFAAALVFYLLEPDLGSDSPIGVGPQGLLLRF